MDFVNPQDLKYGPRIYFTHIDPNNIKNKKEIERILKVQLLTKGHLIIAASHMFHQKSYEFFKEIIQRDKKFLEFFEKGYIVPALRDEFKEDVNYFFKEKREDKGYTGESKKFFLGEKGKQGILKKCLVWRLEDATKFLKSTLIKNLENENSFIHEVIKSKVKLNRTEEMKLKQVVSRIKDLEHKKISLEEIYLILESELGGSECVKDIVSKFSKLVYYISGAYAVKSEGHFPQSNLVDFELVGNEKLLNEYNIFLNFFIEAGISNIEHTTFMSGKELDKLSFEDIIKIRENLFEMKFLESYYNFIKKIKENIHIEDEKKLFMKANEIYETSEELREYLNRIFKDAGMRIKNIDESSNLILGQAISVMNIYGYLLGISEEFSTVLFTVINSLIFMPKIREKKYKLIRDLVIRFGLPEGEARSIIEGFKVLTSYKR